ncbi:MAG: ASCH domain-containing protein [Acidobacteria bacterium]|nr:ASCH domain-containing protein [Acidobacteriota bacterium]
MAKKINRDGWKCLSVHQPYAWAIIMGAKDVDNRSWKSNHLGRLYIHAGLTERDDTVVDEVIARVAKHLRIPISAAREAYRQHRKQGLGAIIGSVHMVGCATSYDSEWFKGEYGFILRDPEPLNEPVRRKGRPRFFTCNP